MCKKSDHFKKGHTSLDIAQITKNWHKDGSQMAK